MSKQLKILDPVIEPIFVPVVKIGSDWHYFPRGNPPVDVGAKCIATFPSPWIVGTKNDEAPFIVDPPVVEPLRRPWLPLTLEPSGFSVSL